MILVKVAKLVFSLSIVLIAVLLIYSIISGTMTRSQAQTNCKETYPTYTEVVGIIGLDIGIACFDESEGKVKFLGMLEE